MGTGYSELGFLQILRRNRRCRAFVKSNNHQNSKFIQKPSCWWTDSRIVRSYPSRSSLYIFWGKSGSKGVMWVSSEMVSQSGVPSNITLSDPVLTHASIYVGSTLHVWLRQHAQDWEKDFLYRLNWWPTLGRRFVHWMGPGKRGGGEETNQVWKVARNQLQSAIRELSKRTIWVISCSM